MYRDHYRIGLFSMRNFILFFLLFLILTFPFTPVCALESPWRSADHVQARLLSGADSTGKADHIDGAIDKTGSAFVANNAPSAMVVAKP